MAQIVISSDFEEGVDGWTAIGDVELFEFRAGGGNPGGHIFVDELRNASYALRFVAPEKFLGDMSLFYGGTLSFDINPTDTSAVPDTLFLVGGGHRVLGRRSH